MTTDRSLNKLGLFSDELNKIRVWDPEASRATKDLSDACEDFVRKVNEFNEIAADLISMTVNLGNHVDRQKNLALGSSNLLMSISKQREAQKQQFQALILERTTELERLRVQHQALLLSEAEQEETLAMLSEN